MTLLAMLLACARHSTGAALRAEPERELLDTALRYESRKGEGSLLSCGPGIWTQRRGAAAQVSAMARQAMEAEAVWQARSTTAVEVDQSCWTFGDAQSCCLAAWDSQRQSADPSDATWPLRRYASACDVTGGRSANGCFGYALLAVQRGGYEPDDPLVLSAVRRALHPD